MRRGLAGLWLVLIVVIVSACGAPQYTFVASSDSHAFFKRVQRARTNFQPCLVALVPFGHAGIEVPAVIVESHRRIVGELE